MSSDKTWAIRVLCLFLVGGGLALVAYFYFLSSPPERASTPPTAPSQDLSGEIDVGSLNGESSSKPGSKPSEGSEDRGVQEAGPGPDRDAPDGVVGSAEGVNASEATPEPADGGLAEPVGPSPESSSEPPPERPEADRPAPEYVAPKKVTEENSAGSPARATPASPETPETPETPEKIPEDNTLHLTIPKMNRVQQAEVQDAAGDDAAALDSGVIHLSGTGFPWEREANVYLAGHRLGYAGTGSHLIFYDLDVLEEGDEVFVEDAASNRYSYRVTGSEEVSPDQLEVARPAPGKNVLTLQTCTLPDYKNRLIVRAERVS